MNDQHLSAASGTMDEIEALFALGDYDGAHAAFHRLPEEIRLSPLGYRVLMQLAKATGDFETAVEVACTRGNEPGFEPAANMAYVLSAFGNEYCRAYEVALQQESVGSTEPLYWFNRACYASQCGEHLDAAISLGKCFETETHFRYDAFLDPDLEGFWCSLEQSCMDIATAERFLNDGWMATAFEWRRSEKPIVVSVASWKQIPAHLRKFVPRREVRNGLEPLDSMPGNLYREFVCWQYDQSEKNVKRLIAFLERGYAELLTCQAAFAVEQGKGGNSTAARYHYLMHRSVYPDRVVPEALIDSANLRYLQADIAEAVLDDPSFIQKVHRIRDTVGDACASLMADAFDDVLPAGRATMLYAFCCARRDLALGDFNQAARQLAPVVEAWPFDASVIATGLEIAARMGDWITARKFLDRAPQSFFEFHVSEILRSWIDTETAGSTRVRCNRFVGQRDLGGHLRPEFAARAGKLASESAWSPA